jgi:hypothetical protein
MKYTECCILSHTQIVTTRIPTAIYSHTPKSGQCELFKPFLVQCAYFNHIRPNLADAKLSSFFLFNAPTLGTYAQIQLMRSFEAVFGSMRLL